MRKITLVEKHRVSNVEMDSNVLSLEDNNDAIMRPSIMNMDNAYSNDGTIVNKDVFERKAGTMAALQGSKIHQVKPTLIWLDQKFMRGIGKLDYKFTIDQDGKNGIETSSDSSRPNTAATRKLKSSVLKGKNEKSNTVKQELMSQNESNFLWPTKLLETNRREDKEIEGIFALKDRVFDMQDEEEFEKQFLKVIHGKRGTNRLVAKVEDYSQPTDDADKPSNDSAKKFSNVLTMKEHKELLEKARKKKEENLKPKLEIEPSYVSSTSGDLFVNFRVNSKDLRKYSHSNKRRSSMIQFSVNDSMVFPEIETKVDDLVEIKETVSVDAANQDFFKRENVDIAVLKSLDKLNVPDAKEDIFGIFLSKKLSVEPELVIQRGLSPSIGARIPKRISEIESSVVAAAAESVEANNPFNFKKSINTIHGENAKAEKNRDIEAINSVIMKNISNLADQSNVNTSKTSSGDNETNVLINKDDEPKPSFHRRSSSVPSNAFGALVLPPISVPSNNEDIDLLSFLRKCSPTSLPFARPTFDFEDVKPEKSRRGHERNTSAPFLFSKIDAELIKNNHSSLGGERKKASANEFELGSRNSGNKKFSEGMSNRRVSNPNLKSIQFGEGVSNRRVSNPNLKSIPTFKSSSQNNHGSSNENVKRSSLIIPKKMIATLDMDNNKKSSGRSLNIQLPSSISPHFKIDPIAELGIIPEFNLESENDYNGNSETIEISKNEKSCNPQNDSNGNDDTIISEQCFRAVTPLVVKSVSLEMSAEEVSVNMGKFYTRRNSRGKSPISSKVLVESPKHSDTDNSLFNNDTFLIKAFSSLPKTPEAPLKYNLEDSPTILIKPQFQSSETNSTVLLPVNPVLLNNEIKAHQPIKGRIHTSKDRKVLNKSKECTSDIESFVLEPSQKISVAKDKAQVNTELALPSNNLKFSPIENKTEKHMPLTDFVLHAEKIVKQDDYRQNLPLILPVIWNGNDVKVSNTIDFTSILLPPPPHTCSFK